MLRSLKLHFIHFLKVKLKELNDKEKRPKKGTRKAMKTSQKWGKNDVTIVN